MSGLSPEQKLEKMGVSLPASPSPAGSYLPCVRSGNLVFVSGQLPLKGGKLLFKGRVGDELTVESANECARLAALNVLAVLRDAGGGSLNAVRKIVKITGYVASAENFTCQADVVNGASDFFAEVFGEKGMHSRAAVGAVQLPLGAPVEIEVIAEMASEQNPPVE